MSLQRSSKTGIAMAANPATDRTGQRTALSAKNRLHGYIAVHLYLSRLQAGYTSVTRLHRCPSATYHSNRQPTCNLFAFLPLTGDAKDSKKAHYYLEWGEPAVRPGHLFMDQSLANQERCQAAHE